MAHYLTGGPSLASASVGADQAGARRLAVKTPGMRIPIPRAAIAAAVALTLGAALLPMPARASLDMVSGARGTAVTAPLADCSTDAKAALGAVLVNPFEAGQGTGQWMAFSATDAAGQSHEAAAMHCFPVGAGYVVTLTCTIERPFSPETATALCGRLEKAFDATGVVTWQ